MRKPKPRYCTRAAIDSLAAFFELPDSPRMQDWEWEVSDASRIGEFLDAYEDAGFDEEERFVLMEMLIQSFEEWPDGPRAHPQWSRLIRLLEENVDLHAHTLWYWGESAARGSENCWAVSKPLWEVLERQGEGE